MNNIKILICCHKTCELPKDNVYLPIHVGAAISDVDFGLQRDDQVTGAACDNISAKNKNYCELTALYWAWKNMPKLYSNLEYIGVSHYRRFFSIPNKKQITFLKKGGVFIPNFKYYPYSVENAYSIEHERFDVEILKQTIKELYPAYEKNMLKVFRGNKTTVCNMFIANKDFYNAYCEWLFSILFEVEKKVFIDHYDDYQKRIFGFMSERLLYIYMLQNKIKFKTAKVKTIDIKEFKGFHRIVQNLRCRLSFFFGAKRHYDV